MKQDNTNHKRDEEITQALQTGKAEFFIKVAAMNKFVEHIHTRLHHAKYKLLIAQNWQI